MKNDSGELRGLPEERLPSESDSGFFGELDEVINILEGQLEAWKSREVCHAIWLLATIANDEQICVENPTRVAEACQNYGHLLYDHEVEMLRRWLVEVNQSRSIEKTTTS